MRESKKRERDEKPASNKPTRRRTQSRVGPPSPVRPLSAVDGVEDRVPNVCSDIGSHVFVEAFAGSGVVPPYLERFANS